MEIIKLIQLIIANLDTILEVIAAVTTMLLIISEALGTSKGTKYNAILDVLKDLPKILKKNRDKSS